MVTKYLNYLAKPIVIGDQQVKHRLFLAPMAGLSHIALRELIASYGPHGLLYSEMCSARAIPHENRNHSTVFRWRNEELPYLVCQIFGSDPQMMALAARRIEDEGFFGVDLNFGCSVSAICKKNCGAALLKSPELVLQIVKTVRRAVSIPLTVKYRTGWHDDYQQAVSLAKRFEEEGANAIIFHPRTAPDRRSRPPRWEYIKHVKEAVQIPVLGNGNVFDPDDVNKMQAISGCDGVAIGRIAVAKPWIFSEWLGGATYDQTIYQECASRMLDLLAHHFNTPQAVRLFKKFAIYFTSNFRFGHSLYSKLCRGDRITDLEKNISSVFSVPPETINRPNLNMFNA